MPPQGPSWISRVIGIGAAVLCLVLLALTIQVLLVPLVAAMFLAYLFEPGIEILQRRGMARGRAYLIVFGLSSIGVIALFSLAPAWLSFETAPGSTQTLSERLQTQLRDLENWADSHLPMFKSVHFSERISTQAVAIAERLITALPTLVTSFIVNLILVPFIAYFMVRDGRKLRRRIVALVPNRYFEMSLIMFHRIDEQIGGYLRGRLIECILIGLTQMLLMGLASVIVEQPQILLISIVCGMTSVIPYAGPVMGTAFGVFYYFALGLPTNSIMALLIIAAVAHLIDNIIIAPAVLSHNVDLHPLTVALVLVIGGEVLGVLGLLIAIPVASTVKVVVQEFYTNYQVQVR
jgi:predicted PurR-regulated permease PerM